MLASVVSSRVLETLNLPLSSLESVCEQVDIRFGSEATRIQSLTLFLQFAYLSFELLDKESLALDLGLEVLGILLFALPRREPVSMVRQLVV